MAPIFQILLNYYGENKLTALATLVLTLLYYPVDIIAVSNLTSHLLLLTSQGVRQNYNQIFLTIGFLLLAYIALEIIGVLKDYLDTTNIPKFENYVRDQIIKPVFTKNLVNYDNVETVQVIENLQKVPKILSDVFERFNRFLLPFLMIIVSVSVYFFTLNRKLGIIALALFLIYSLIFIIVGNGLLTASTSRELAENEFYGKIEDIINNIFTVTLANTGQKELKNINQFSEKFNNIYHEEMVASSKSKFLTGIAVVGLIAALVWTVLSLTRQGQMSQSSAVLAFGTVIFMSRHFRSLTRRVIETVIEIGSLVGRDQFLESTRKSTIKNGTRRDFIKNGEVVFRNVDFRYGPDSPKILDNFQLHKEGNSSITIKGPSGCGKSTLIKLLNGYFTPESGQILIDGVDLREVDRYYLRDVVSYLPQGARLFDRPIIENMIYGTNAKPLDVVRVLRELGVEKIFNGVDLTRSAGRFGDKLSGGQRQVVHLVRIYLANPKIVILDEPTTGIDREHQKYIRRAIQALSATTNLILITHEKDFSVGKTVNFNKES